MHRSVEKGPKRNLSPVHKCLENKSYYPLHSGLSGRGKRYFEKIHFFALTNIKITTGRNIVAMQTSRSCPTTNHTKVAKFGVQLCFLVNYNPSPHPKKKKHKHKNRKIVKYFVSIQLSIRFGT